MSHRHELIKGSVDSLLLSLLGQQPMYGYQIIKELEGRSQGYFKFKEGTLYPALHRLEKMGLLTATWQTAVRGRQRRYYRLTEKGYTVLIKRRGQWLDFFKAMNTFIQPASV